MEEWRIIELQLFEATICLKGFSTKQHRDQKNVRPPTAVAHDDSAFCTMVSLWVSKALVASSMCGARWVRLERKTLKPLLKKSYKVSEGLIHQLN